MVKALIEEGDNVIFKREEGSSRVFQIRRKRMVYFSKLKFSTDELIGQPYGSTFELERGKLTKVIPDAQQEAESFTGVASLDQSADNRHLTDSERNQNLSKDDIMKMKDEGIGGEKIIEELVENSETFKTKTEFSQAKYLKKKKKKHMSIFTVYQPSLRLIMEMYAKEPGKINFLRSDSLSQLLCFSNVMYGSRVAVMESCQGLVVGALLERMGGAGKLIQLIPNNNNPPCRQIVDYFSFPKEHLDNLYTFPLDQLWTLKSEDTTNTTSENGSGDGTNGSTVEMESLSQQNNNDASNKASNSDTTVVTESVEMKSQPEETTESSNAESKAQEDKTKDETAEEGKGESMECDESESSKSNTAAEGTEGEEKPPVFVKNRDIQRKVRAQRLKEAGDVIRQKQIDSLVIACKQNPVPVLKRMLEVMGLSRPVVVFCQYIDPLIECYTYVKEQHAGIQLRLWDSWFREYQVLPQRTHPNVMMSGTGGYLLTFITTEPSATS